MKKSLNRKLIELVLKDVDKKYNNYSSDGLQSIIETNLREKLNIVFPKITSIQEFDNQVSGEVFYIDEDGETNVINFTIIDETYEY